MVQSHRTLQHIPSGSLRMHRPRIPWRQSEYEQQYTVQLILQFFILKLIAFGYSSLQQREYALAARNTASLPSVVGLPSSNQIRFRNEGSGHTKEVHRSLVEQLIDYLQGTEPSDQDERALDS